jgi:hypothetical protein
MYEAYNTRMRAPTVTLSTQIDPSASHPVHAHIDAFSSDDWLPAELPAYRDLFLPELTEAWSTHMIMKQSTSSASRPNLHM